LTIHHFDKGAGKNKLHWQNAKDLQPVADGVIQMIAEIPNSEPVLIVTHKWKTFKDRRTGEEKPWANTLPAMVEAKRKARKGSVEYLNYGKHTATNAYKDCRYVICAGVLTYNNAQYEAMGRSARKLKTEDAFSDDDLWKVRIGEISHHIFQAAGRGSIRKTVNGGCPEGCHLYMIFSTQKPYGFPKEELLTIFPDAELGNWYPDGGPAPTKLTGHAEHVAEFIASVVLSGGTLTTNEVRAAIGLDRQYLNKILKREDLQEAITKHEIVYEPGSGTKPGVFRGA
jgi:hypothetical protein